MKFTDPENADYINERKIMIIAGANKGMVHQNAADYLRSLGYALAFAGYSVEQMIANGWIKLRQG